MTDHSTLIAAAMPLSKACHDHNLEDKVVVNGWSNVMTQFLLKPKISVISLFY